MQRWNKALRDDMSEFASEVWWNEQFHISGRTEDFGFFIISTKRKKNKQKTKQRKKPNTFWSRGVLLSGSVDLNIRAFKQERNKLW